MNEYNGFNVTSASSRDCNSGPSDRGLGAVSRRRNLPTSPSEELHAMIPDGKHVKNLRRHDHKMKSRDSFPRKMPSSISSAISSGQSKSKKDRHSFNKRVLNKCPHIIAMLILASTTIHLYCVHQLLLQQNWNHSGFGRPGNQNWKDLYHKRTEERKQRTRPPRHYGSKEIERKDYSNYNNASSTWFYRPEAVTLAMEKLSLSKSSEYQHYDWDSLCQQARLISESRVIITGVLSHPTGTALALLMAQQCHVKHIMGIDAIFPNLRKYRMSVVDDSFRLLKRQIPNFQMVVPDFNSALMYSGNDANATTIQGFRPTHIVHLNALISLLNFPTSKIMEDAQQILYFSQKSLAWMQQLLEISLSIFTESRPKVEMPVFVHVTTSATEIEPSSSHVPLRTTPVLSSTYYDIWGVKSSHLELPGIIYGPLVSERHYSNISNGVDRIGNRCIYVDDATAAILMSMSKENASGQPKTFQVPKNRTNTQEWLARSLHFEEQGTNLPLLAMNVGDERLRQTIDWKRFREYPYGNRNSSAAYSSVLGSKNHYARTYGVHTKQFSCSSTCLDYQSKVQCLKSPFDRVTPLSRAVTEDFPHVVYMANFSQHLDTLLPFVPMTNEPQEILRVAYVSGQSKLVKQILADQGHSTSQAIFVALEKLNGEISFNGWTLIWLSQHDDQLLSDADYALPQIDPGQLMHTSVKNAVFVEGTEGAGVPDIVFFNLMNQMNKPNQNKGMLREVRKGTSLKRWVPVPAERARQSVFFAAESQIRLDNIDEVADFAGDTSVPKKQIDFYRQVSHWVQSSELGHKYDFPFQWVSTALLVHDFTMEQSRQFRCDWYNEYLYWGSSNRHFTNLSLAYLMGKMLIKGTIGKPLKNNEEDRSWRPFLIDNDSKLLSEQEERVLNNIGNEIFIRILRNKHRPKP